MNLRSVGFLRSRSFISAISAVLLATILLSPAQVRAAPCESLSSLALPSATITLAQSVAAGSFTLPGGGRGAAEQNAALKALPAFCRVAATLRPTSDSDIKIEVWMPVSNWNGKFQAVGNGGWAGSISYPAMIQALRRGYATSSTDTGHAGGNGAFAFQHPEKFIDYAYRSEHEMAMKTKTIITAFYGNGPSYSYWNGCSTGGRQGLAAAERFPDDWDGIIAGSQANPRTHLNGWEIAVAKIPVLDKAKDIPKSKFPMIHEAVMKTCDAVDGLKDSLISDPTRCKFDPKVLMCKGADNALCLTAPQVEMATKLMSSATTKTGAEIFPGLEPGTELFWGRFVGDAEPPTNAIDQYRYIVFKNPEWDWTTFDIERDVATADTVDKGTINAVNPDLSKFVQRKGKLLLYHGWTDGTVSPLTSVNYYNRVVDKMGGTAKTSNWLRLFMVPGMGHCGGGDGPNTFDTVTALEQWVEKGKAPDQIIASHSTAGKIDRTRPLCPYPQVAKYKGSGSIDDAANFDCKAP